MVWFLVVLFALMSVMFLMGKGTFLIAGYNTASQKEKEQYDEKKLCLVMGIGCALMSLSMFIPIILKNKVTLSMIMMSISVAFIIIGIQFFCKNKDIQVTTKASKMKDILSAAFPLIVVGSVTIMMFAGHIDIKIQQDYLRAQASGFGVKAMDIYYDDVEDIVYTSDIELGKRIWGIGSSKLQTGHFKNEQYGKYQLYSYTKCHDYVVLKTKDGYIVVNQEDEIKTKELYEELEEKLK